MILVAPPIGLVLSGGGARGAYEVGVLQYIAESQPELLERVSVITGTSVGAVNAAYLAAGGLTPDTIGNLARIWSALDMDKMITAAPTNALSMIGRASLRLVRKKTTSPAVGLLSVDGLQRLVAKEIDWRRLHRQIARGRFDAVAVAATDIATGDTHLFVDAKDGSMDRWASSDASLKAKVTPLGPHHVLASAAIPILFPPVKVQGRWYMDGGLRYNTPLSPALRLGAKSLIIVSVRAGQPEAVSPDIFPGLGHVVGKLMDAIFLDRVAFDLDRVSRINDLVASIETLPDDAKDTLRIELERRGRRLYEFVPFADVKPSVDLGRLAADYLRDTGRHKLGTVGRWLWALFEDDAQSTAEAASFLLFDGDFARLVIDAGRRDAEAAHAVLASL